MIKNLKKELNQVQTFFVNYKGEKIPYTVEYVGEDEDGSIFHLTCKQAKINQDFIEEDLDLIVDKVIIESLDDFYAKNTRKTMIAVRFFDDDLDFIKSYARKKGYPYQSLVRVALKEYNEKLRKEENKTLVEN